MVLFSVAGRGVLLCCPESLVDIRRSWDNLMWNLEVDDNDDEAEEAVALAMNGVLSALVLSLIHI